VSGNDFHLINGYNRSKNQAAMAQNNPNVDGHAYYLGGNINRQSPYIDRSTSPMSTNGRILTHGDKLDERNDISPSSLERSPRNQLHASLECLNTAYSEYGLPSYSINYKSRCNAPQAQLPPQYHQQQYKPPGNQHYATSYVLTAAPAETVINPNGYQDLAAAAMGNPMYLQQNKNQYTSNNMVPSQNAYLAHNLLSKSNMNTSPMRRMVYGSNHIATNVSSTNVSNQLSNTNQSMRAGYSSISLASSTLLIEDKLQNEIKKLQSELISEKEKNEALNSQLNINSNLMAAFEQSLTTLNNRLRQMTTLNEEKDKKIEELEKSIANRREETSPEVGKNEKSTSPICDSTEIHRLSWNEKRSPDAPPLRDTKKQSEMLCNESEQGLLRIIDDLKRQLIEKDRLLTDTRLEALSAAHQLEQLESRLNGEHSFVTNEEDLDEGVMVINNSPSDSDAITDSTHFSELNNQTVRSTVDTKDTFQKPKVEQSNNSYDSHEDIHKNLSKLQLNNTQQMDEHAKNSLSGYHTDENHSDDMLARENSKQDCVSPQGQTSDDTISQMLDNDSINN